MQQQTAAEAYRDQTLATVQSAQALPQHINRICARQIAEALQGWLASRA
jgi:hypothetical protein